MSNHRALIQKLHGIAKKAARQSVTIEEGLSALNHFGFSFISLCPIELDIFLTPGSIIKIEF